MLLPISSAYRPRLTYLGASNSGGGDENSPVAEMLKSDDNIEDINKTMDVVRPDQPKRADVVERRHPPPPPPSWKLAGPASVKGKNLRMKLFYVLNLPVVEVFAALAVLLSSFLVALGTLDDLPPVTTASINDALLALNLIFAADFFVRWYAAGQFKPIYLRKPLVVVDIVVVVLPLVLGTIIPLLEYIGVLEGGEGGTADAFLLGLQNSAGLQNLLLLRVLRLRRVLTDIGTFRNFFSALPGFVRPRDVRPYQLQLARVLLSIFTLLSVASGLIYTAEHDVNPDITDYFSALYFGLTTLTTVGFGDIAPVTWQGRLVVCGSILAGVAVVPAQAAKLVDAIIGFQMEQEEKKGAGGGLSGRRGGGFTGDVAGLGRTTSTMIGRGAAVTDGKGPSGTPIDTPPKESLLVETPLVQRDDGEQQLLAPGLACGRCGASPHRADASFCWSCGADLRRQAIDLEI